MKVNVAPPDNASILKNNIAAIICALLLILPSVGANTETILQDTLKSLIASLCLLSALAVVAHHLQSRGLPIITHWTLGLPVLLCLYALGSMAWSHTYLAGVEAIRWFLFGLILIFGVNSLSSQRLYGLLWCVHIGASISSLWAAMQFWNDFQFFAQGPNPASTFVNRNFFAEYIACTIPLSVMLVFLIKQKVTAFLIGVSLTLNVIVILMTGTRSALVAIALFSIMLTTFLLVCRPALASGKWKTWQWSIAFLALLAIGYLLGAIPTNNPKIISESGAGDAFHRSTSRLSTLTKATDYTSGSISVRMQLWTESLRMIVDHPLTGVGSGAWEVNAPLYQDHASVLETDYYAHNEFLQLLSEYGVVGWIFLLSLFAYLLFSIYTTWSLRKKNLDSYLVIRFLCLASIAMLMTVSFFGFPWRLAGTGVLFALCLGILGASDIHLAQYTNMPKLWKMIDLSPSIAPTIITCSFVLCATYISWAAIQCEYKIVSAIKVAGVIRNSPNPNDQRLEPIKKELLALIEAGIAINPHYRKLTPIVADSLASWGDWKNATSIWERTLNSRPHIVVMTANMVRGHLQLGDLQTAALYLEKLKRLRPETPYTKAMQVLFLSHTGKEPDAGQAIVIAQQLLSENYASPEFLQAAYRLGVSFDNDELAIRALGLRIQNWPSTTVGDYLRLGMIYAKSDSRYPGAAIESYSKAYWLASATSRKFILDQIPQSLHSAILSQPH